MWLHWAHAGLHCAIKIWELFLLKQLVHIITIVVSCHTRYREYLSEVNLFLFFFMFMGPCIVNVFKYNQQDATLHHSSYYYKCSTCFRRFLRPSSGAQNCIHSIGYLSSFFCFSPQSWLSFNSLTIAVRSRKSSRNTWCCVYSFELLMMGGGTVWNM